MHRGRSARTGSVAARFAERVDPAAPSGRGRLLVPAGRAVRPEVRAVPRLRDPGLPGPRPELSIW